MGPLPRRCRSLHGKEGTVISSTPDKLVERYLKHLDVELDDLPRDRRREIVDEISGHIAEARAGLEAETESDLRNILDDLGDPAEIAGDARERFDVRPLAGASAGAMEVGALVMLLIGGLVLPGVGWLIGVVLLWVSNAWNVRDKVIGTIFVPGGLGISLFLFFAVGTSSGGSSEACSGLSDLLNESSSPQVTTCTESGTSAGDIILIVGMIALLITPIVTTAYLAYRLRQRTRAAAVA